MDGQRPLVIVNPRSGGGRTVRTFADVRAVLERRLGVSDVAFTSRPGHAIDLARDAAREGRALVIAVGGDGTLHEVANGVLDAGRAASVGYIGMGTGGDFRRSLGIEHRLDAYVRAIADGGQRRLDAARVRYRAPDGTTRERWFVNILSAGLGGLVDRHVAETSKAFGGTAAYFWASLRALLESQRARLTCVVDFGEQHRELRLETYMIAVCNGRFFGGGMQVAPMAKLDDGRLEVISMDAPSKLAFAVFARSVYRGAHLSSPGVQHFSCDRIAIDLESQLGNERTRGVFLLDVDGEPLGSLPIQVELVRGALSMRG